MSDILAGVTKLANQHLDAATAEAWLRLVRPTVALVEATPNDHVVARLGGQPRLPAGTPWPQWGGATPLSYDVLWGDVGTLYWLARAEDLRRGDLSNTRFVMQCC